MPNWCYTYITINCRDQKSAETMHENIKEWMSSNYCENDFGNTWLGNIIGNSGIDSINENGIFSLRCRGAITYLDQDDEQIFIITETAWKPMLRMWSILCDTYLGKEQYELIYSTNLNGEYFSNDPIDFNSYFYDVINQSEDSDKVLLILDHYKKKSCEYLSENEITQFLKKTKRLSIDSLLHAYLENSESNDANIQRGIYVGVEEWD